jgi:hypothetical protein
MIDDDAFTGCESLQQIDLPDQMTYIGYFAFSNSGLTSFKVPSFVSYIGMGAFNGCKNLAWIDSNSSTYYTIDGVLVETIGMDETIHTYPNRPDEIYEIPERITKIAPMAFGNTTHLKEVKLSPNMSMINARAFYNCESLERIEIPEYIFKIEEMAFYNCKNLKEVILDEGLIRIGYDAFQNSGIETITIPSSVKYLDDYAFCGCELLRQIDIYSDEVIMNECLVDMCPSLVEINIYGANITTNEFTFTSIYNEETIIIHTQKGVKLEGIPFDSNIVVKHFGERPYPWENLIGVFVCVMVLIFVFRNIRGV